MGRTWKPEWSVSRSVSLKPEDAKRLDAIADSLAKRNRSAFLREMVTAGLVAKYGTKWQVYADALLAGDTEAAA
jgi:predicted transcriptional regulator